MDPCPRCGARPQTPLVCTGCELLLDPPEGAHDFEALGPFALLGLSQGFELDGSDLRARLVRLSRHLHPDFFAAAGPKARGRAEERSAALNWAYRILADDARRADWLIGALGGPTESDERQMPQAFLLEVLEWNEALEEARCTPTGSDARAALPALASSLRGRRDACICALRRLLSPAPEPGSGALRDARRELNAVRYLDRALQELEALRLEEAATR